MRGSATEIVDAESLSSGARILAPSGKVWLVLGEPDEDTEREQITMRLTVVGENAPEVKRTVHRTTKYAVLCG